MNKKGLILKLMKEANKPMKSGEISELSKLPKSEVTKIISKLKKEGLIESPKRCYYIAKR